MLLKNFQKWERTWQKHWHISNQFQESLKKSYITQQTLNPIALGWETPLQSSAQSPEAVISHLCRKSLRSRAHPWEMMLFLLTLAFLISRYLMFPLTNWRKAFLGLGEEKSRWPPSCHGQFCWEQQGRSQGKECAAAFSRSPLQKWASSDSHRDQQLCDSTMTQSVFKRVEVNSYWSDGLRPEKELEIIARRFQETQENKQAVSYMWGLKQKNWQRKLFFLDFENWLQTEVRLFILGLTVGTAVTLFLPDLPATLRVSHRGSNSYSLYFIILKALLISDSRVTASMGNSWVWSHYFINAKKGKRVHTNLERKPKNETEILHPTSKAAEFSLTICLFKADKKHMATSCVALTNAQRGASWESPDRVCKEGSRRTDRTWIRIQGSWAPTDGAFWGWRTRTLTGQVEVLCSHCVMLRLSSRLVHFFITMSQPQ